MIAFVVGAVKNVIGPLFVTDTFWTFRPCDKGFPGWGKFTLIS
jgi:hypothetical protein